MIPLPDDDSILDPAALLYIQFRNAVGDHLNAFTVENADHHGIVVATALMGMGAHCFLSLLDMTVGDEDKQKMAQAIFQQLDGIKEDILAEFPTRPTSTTVH